MNRSDKLAVVGAVIMSYEAFSFAIGPVIGLYLPEITACELPVAIAGWVIASYGPIVVATLFWRLADRLSMGWLLHILLVPCLYALLLTGERLMLSTVSDPDFDGTLGAPIMPAMFCDLVVIVVYFSALVAKQVFKSRPRSTGS
jgi:hypothetical protein